jgi:hypothetical protein
MKFFLILLLSFLFTSAFAFYKSYNVAGIADNLGPVQGVAYYDIGDDPDLTGELMDEDGKVHSFEGSWIDNGLIGGETDDGHSVELSVR